MIDKPRKIPRIKDIYTVMRSNEGIFQYLDGEKAIEAYWDSFIVDALIGNFDRHANNWGYLFNPTTKDAKIAPVFDCGSCLYPQLTDEAIENILNKQDEIQLRIDKFPTAALDIGNGIKANYKEYIGSFENKDCVKALQRIYPKINLEFISDIIDSVDGISDVRRHFYKLMLNERYRQIIQQSYLLYS